MSLKFFSATTFDVGKLKPEYIFKKIIHFLKPFIQNKHSFLKEKTEIFIQNKYSFLLNPEYAFKEIFIFLKEAVSPTPIRRGNSH